MLFFFRSEQTPVNLSHTFGCDPAQRRNVGKDKLKHSYQRKDKHHHILINQSRHQELIYATSKQRQSPQKPSYYFSDLFQSQKRADRQFHRRFPRKESIHRKATEVSSRHSQLTSKNIPDSGCHFNQNVSRDVLLHSFSKTFYLHSVPVIFEIYIFKCISCPIKYQ